MTAPPVTALADLAGDFLAAVADAMSDYGQPVFGRTAVVPGAEPVWDDCCNGQLSVWVEQVYPTVTFPIAAGLNECFPPARVAVVLVVETVRCGPTIDDLGRVPTVAALETASSLQLGDALAVIRGVLCFTASLIDDDLGVVAGVTTFPGPEGACIASQTRVTVEMDVACICDPA